MAPQRQINWQKLAEIYELKEFFAADFAGFQAEIEQQLQDLDRFPTETLDKLAKLRALEVTNGITNGPIGAARPKRSPSSRPGNV